MITSNRRLFLAIFLSLVILFGIKYISSNPLLFSPSNIYASITQKTAEIKAKIFSIKLPDFSKIFTLNFNPDNNETPLRPSGEGQAMNFNLPVSIHPTSPRQSPSITRTTAGPLPTYEPYIRPTTILVPTTRPQPTAIPQPIVVPTSAPAPITSNRRPGNSLAEIFEEVNKRICVPVALLRAFQEAESGTWFKYTDNPVPYNTYGWWTTAGGPDPCHGMGYDESTGYVFPDHYNKSIFCMITPGANPGQAGLFSLSQWEQDTSRKNTIAFLPNNIDRRVAFDDTLIFASITINRVVEPSCGETWSDDVVRQAALKHNNSTTYSDEILSLYKKYR